jgi:hypothetical protein
MRKPARKEVVKRSYSPVGLWELEGTAEQIYEMLKGVERDYFKKGFLSVRFEIDFGYDDANLEVVATRMETDAEYERRIQKEADARKKKREAKRQKEESERKLYDRLHKKYGRK